MYKQYLAAAETQIDFPARAEQKTLGFPSRICVVAPSVDQIMKLMCFQSKQSTASEPRPGGDTCGVSGDTGEFESNGKKVRLGSHKTSFPGVGLQALQPPILLLLV